MKNPTMRKLKNRNLTPIRYNNGQQYKHGWIVKHRTRGALTVRLVGEERNRNLPASEARYVQAIS